mmetsp:Transcript_44408/g.112372  ORF Transcript_44408/g.112372 Transcript_44408/m.112372 type:complete len:187 (+) Transcript_44408:832-1392(+)
MRVAAGGEHLHDAAAHLQDADVEGAAAQVKHHHRLVLLQVQAIRQGGGDGLPDEAHCLQPRDLPRRLSRRLLLLVKVGRHRDDGLGDGGAGGGLRVAHQARQHLGAHLLGVQQPALHVAAAQHCRAVLVLAHVVRHAAPLLAHRPVVCGAADEALHGVEGVLWTSRRVPPRHLAHHHLPVGAERHD